MCGVIDYVGKFVWCFVCYCQQCRMCDDEVCFYIECVQQFEQLYVVDEV